MRAATAGTVAPSHLLLKFGKLTIKLEMLSKKLKVCGFKISPRRRAGGCGAACLRLQKNKAAVGSLVCYLNLII